MRPAALPSWTPPPEHGRRPFALQRAAREIRERLGRAGERLRSQLRGVPLHDGSHRDREMYRPRLEACLKVLQCLLHHTDVVTLVVGKAEDGSFKGLRLDTLAERTGLGERRVDRAVRDLHLADFLCSATRAERVRDGYRGLTAVRQLSIELFSALGLADMLEKARRTAYASRKAAGKFVAAAYQRFQTKAQEFTAASDKRRYGRRSGHLADFLPHLER